MLILLQLLILGRLNLHMVGGVTHHQMIVMVVVAVVSVVECPDVLIIEVRLIVYVLCALYILHPFLRFDYFCFFFSVFVTGLPHSASWQDLKVSLRLSYE